MPAIWVFAAIGALLVAHLALVALAIRRGGRYPAGSVDSPTLLDPGGAEHDESVGGEFGAGSDAVRCRECRAVNRAEYRYCRECVTEIPTDSSLGGVGSSESSRRTI